MNKIVLYNNKYAEITIVRKFSELVCNNYYFSLI